MTTGPVKRALSRRAALSLAIAAALYQTARLDGRTRAGLALLIAWAACSGLLAFFADDPAGTPRTGSGVVHVILALIAFTCIAVGAILISAGLMSDPAWRAAAPVLLAISIGGALACLLLGTANKHHHAPAASTSESSSVWNSCGWSSPPSPSPGGPARSGQNDPIPADPADPAEQMGGPRDKGLPTR